jgi:hypothetical protein
MDVVDCEESKQHRRCKEEDGLRVEKWLLWILQLGPQDSALRRMTPSQVEHVPQLHWHLNTHLQGKRMFKTKKGYIGLASKEAQRGDQVHLIAAESYPYILRPKRGRSDSPTFSLVCPSYVHGWMDGPASELEESPLSFKLVSID